MRREVPHQSRLQAALLDDLANGRRIEPFVEDAPALEDPAEDRPLGDAADFQPLLERGRGDARDRLVVVGVDLAVLVRLGVGEGVDIAARTDLAQVFQGGAGDLRAAPPATAQPKRRRARSRLPRGDSSQVANTACSGSFVNAACLCGFTPRLAWPLRAFFNSSRTCVWLQGLSTFRFWCALDSTARRCTRVLSA